MPIYVTVRDSSGRVLYLEKVSTIPLASELSRIFDRFESMFKTRFELLRRVFSPGSHSPDPAKLLDEILALLSLLTERPRELGSLYFFVIMPRDYEDLISLIVGGAIRVQIPPANTWLIGGYNRAVKLEGEESQPLEEGDEIRINELRFKVLSKDIYEFLSGPLKALLTAALIAKRSNGLLKVSSTGLLTVGLER